MLAYGTSKPSRQSMLNQNGLHKAVRLVRFIILVSHSTANPHEFLRIMRNPRTERGRSQQYYWYTEEEEKLFVNGRNIGQNVVTVLWRWTWLATVPRGA